MKFLVLVIASILANVLMWGSLIYVGLHFAQKWW